MSEKNRGRKRSEQQKEHLRKINLGKKHSEETKRKMSNARKGKHYSLGCHHSIEANERQSKRMMGENNHFFGKHHTEETKRLIRQNSSWYRHSEETKRKISEAGKGRKPNLGKKWFNNGEISVRAFDCPEGFTQGRIFKRHNKRNKE